MFSFCMKTNFSIYFITTSRHAHSKLCPEHCLAEAKADAELCCRALPLNSRCRYQTPESQKHELPLPARAALPASQCSPGLITILLLFTLYAEPTDYTRGADDLLRTTPYLVPQLQLFHFIIIANLKLIGVGRVM